MELVIEMPADAKKVATEALSWPEKARALTVEDDDTFVQAGELLTGIKGLLKRIDETFNPIISKAHAAHVEACDQKRNAAKPLVEAESILKRSLSAYHQKKEEERRAEERRLQEEARKEEERRRLEDAAALEREAIATGDTSLKAEAEAIISEPIQTPAVVVPRATPKVAGIAPRETWRVHETVDIKKLAAEVAAGRQPTALLLPNFTALNAQARALKKELKIPGVQVICENGISARGR